jgi:hypothetical protein
MREASRFHDRSKYCHNGGMASAPSSRTDATAGSWGSMIGTHGPHRGTLRSCRFAGEMVCGGGADAFGCADELEWLRGTVSYPGKVLRDADPQRNAAWQANG